MPGRLPRVTGADVLRALERTGWQRVTQTGSHVQLRHASHPGRVTIPIHRGQTLGPRLMRSILDQAGLSVDEFIELL